MSCLQLLFNIGLESLGKCNKIIKVIHTGKEERKLLSSNLFEDGIITYVEIPKNLQKKKKSQKTEFNYIGKYRIDVQKSMVYLHINKEQGEIKI